MAAKRPEPADDRRGADQPKSRASWRKGPATATANQPAWSTSQWSKVDPAVHRGTLERRFKLAGLLVILALLSTGYAYYVFYSPVKAPVIALALHRFESPLVSPNSWAFEDVERFASASGNLAVHVASLEDLVERVKKEPPGGPNRNVTVVYLSGQGVVNDNAEPCLIDPATATPLDSQKWLRVDDLLKDICSARSGSGTKKLVLLDCGRIDYDWSLGVIKNDFSARVAEAVARLNVPELTVICSAGPGQRSYAAPELGGSVFGYFAARGLHGEADELGDADGEVTISELEKYLRSNVARWVTEHRAGLQQPQLISATDTPADYAIAYAETKSARPAPPEFTLAGDARWEDLAPLWDQHTKLKRDRVYRYAPLQFAALEAKLIRLEQLLLAGSAYDEAYKNVKGKIELLIGELEKPVEELPGVSLVVWKTAPEFASARDSAAELLKVWPPRPGQPPAKLDDFGYESRVVAGFDHILKQPTQARLAEALALIDSSKSAGTRVPPIELHYARMLKQYLDDGASDSDLAETLQLRGDAEKVAWPNDERVQYWTGRLIAAADGDRRRAEDLLLVGGSQELQEAREIWRNAVLKQGNTYAAAGVIIDELTAAYQLRDRGLAEAGYYAQWLLGSDNVPPEQRNWASEYVAALQKLSQALEEPLQEETADNRLTTIRQAHATARALDKQLSDHLQSEQGRLVATSGADQELLRDLESVLSTPLVSGENRTELRRRYRNLLIQIASQPTAAGGASDESPLPASDVTEPQPEHVAFALLSDARPASASADDKQDEKQETWAEQAVRMRKRLTELSTLANDAAQETTGQLTGKARSSGEDTFAVRGGYSRADRLLRGAASVGGDWAQRDELSEGDRFSRQLADLDAHNLLLLQTQRILDDFWGSGGAGEPYFAAAAQTCLSAAKSLLPKNHGVAQREALAETLQGRVQAAQKFAVQDPKRALDPLDVGQLTVDRPAELPKGTAAAYLDAQGAVPALFDEGTEPRRRWSLPIDGSAPTLAVSYRLAPGEAKLPEQLSTVVLYRGHYRSKPVSIASEEGLQIAYEPVSYPAPRVTLQGKLQDNGVILFVFDCSGSMSELSGNRKRMEVARTELIRILTLLAEHQYQVGLMFYGHRVHFEAKTNEEGKKDYVIGYSNYAKNRGPQLKLSPNEDVELVREIGRFSKVDLKQVSQTLDELQPWGQTPVYLSIKEGLKALRSMPNNIEKHMIVITDGVNDLFRPGPAEKRATADEILAALKTPADRGVKIDIIGFHVRAESNTERAEIQKMKDIAGKAAGEFYPADSSARLTDALKKSLGLRRYVVEAAEERGRLSSEDGLELGQSWDRIPKLSRPRDYYVRIPDYDPPLETALKLEGGEGIQLFLGRSAQLGDYRLEHRLHDPAEHPVRGFFGTATTAGGTSRQAKIGVHLPERKLDRMIFRLSVQNVDPAKFSPRPVESWVEIQPQDSAGKAIGQSYTFYDQEFELRQPVPVLMCSCPGWPPAADKAAVSLWCKFDRRTPFEETTIGALQKAPLVLANQKFTFGKTTMAGDLVSFVVFQEARTPLSEPCKVELDPAPKRVVHEFFPGSSRVKHTFIIDESLAGQINDSRLRVTSKRALADGSVQLTEPVVRLLPRE